jgi:putative redox protein
MARTTTIRFPGGSGFELAGTIVEPDTGHARNWALLSHCFTCNRNYKVLANVSRVLADLGWGVMRFDFTGLGDSGGSFEDTTLSSNIQDVIAAANHLAANYGSPDLFVGHSLGGAAGILAAKQIESLRCLATIATPANPAKLARLFSEANRTAWEGDPETVAHVQVSGRMMPFKAKFLADIAQYDLTEEITTLGLPVLLFHSPADTTTSVHNAERLFEAAGHPKSFVSLGDSDHLVSKREDAEMIGRILAAWAVRYVG